MKKNILFYISSLSIGGTERVLLSYIKGVVESGKYNVFLMILRNDRKHNILIDEVPKEVKVEYVFSESYDAFLQEISKNRRKKPVSRLVYQLLLPYGRSIKYTKTKKFIESNKIDILVDFEANFMEKIDTLKCKKIHFRHFSLAAIKEGKNGNEKLEKFGKMLGNYDISVLISDEMKEEAMMFFPNLKDKFRRLYNPQDVERVKALSCDRKNITKEEEILLNDNYLVFVGRIERIKGLSDLIEVYRMCEKEIEEKLYIIGSGTERESLEKLVKEYNLEKKILFLGPKSNPFLWMKNAKLFLTTTYGEGLPTTYIESMIVGTPIISYNSPTGPSDILGKGEYGVLVKTGDKVAFSNELLKLLKDPSKIEEFKRKSEKHIINFSKEDIIPKFMDILDKL